MHENHFTNFGGISSYSQLNYVGIVYQNIKYMTLFRLLFELETKLTSQNLSNRDLKLCRYFLFTLNSTRPSWHLATRKIKGFFSRGISLGIPQIPFKNFKCRDVLWYSWATAPLLLLFLLLHSCLLK